MIYVCCVFGGAFIGFLCATLCVASGRASDAEQAERDRAEYYARKREEKDQNEFGE